MKKLLVILSVGGLLSCSSSDDDYKISFHGEADSTSSLQFATPRDPRSGKFYEQAAIVTQENFKAYYPVAGSDGITYGAVFLVDPKFHHRVEAYTSMHLNGFMIPMVNKRMMEAQQIDFAVKDKFYIPYGFSAADIQQVSKIIPIAKGYDGREKQILQQASSSKPLLAPLKTQLKGEEKKD